MKILRLAKSVAKPVGVVAKAAVVAGAVAFGAKVADHVLDKREEKA